MGNEKVWTNFGTALTTFVSGKQLARAEQSKDVLAEKQPDTPKEKVD
jgi:hypothetical protein